MGHYAARNGVKGYVDDNGTFWPNRGETSGYNDALAQANSLRSHEKSMQNLDGLTDHQAALAKQYQGVNFSKALRGLFGQGGSLDPMLAGIDAEQETYKGKVYNQRRNVDQWRVRQGLKPLYKWEGGLNPSVPPTKYRDSSVSENSLVPGGPSILGIPNSQFYSHYGLVDPAARNVPQVTLGELARKSEADRMMQQYASDEYWDTEAGKVMMDLGSQESYEGDNLAEFYNAQQAVGTGAIDEIIDDMGYTGNMETWARANPALALREYQKNSEALPTDGYAGTGTGELKVDEQLKDVPHYSGAYTLPTQVVTPQQATANEFLQQQVGQPSKAPWVIPESDEPISGIQVEGLMENIRNPYEEDLSGSADWPVLTKEQLEHWQQVMNGQRGAW